jgi:adenosine deaminase
MPRLCGHLRSSKFTHCQSNFSFFILSCIDAYPVNHFLKTILAHGIYLSDDELEVLHKFQTSISHCPNSNCSIRSGMCDVRRLMMKGLHVGLGTGKNSFIMLLNY